jgi:hypothetical protein
MFKSTLVAAAGMMIVGTAHAGLIVEIEITGEVVFNGINDSPLSGVMAGDSAVMTFQVDAGNFVDGIPGDVRGYEIIQSSFSMTFGGDIVQELLNPYPGTPYFGIVDGFPVSDGFFVSSFPTSPGGVALEQEPFNANFSVGYEGDTLDSLDILDAVGTYGFDGLTSFGYNLWAFSPDNVALDINFETLQITALPAPPALAILASLAVIGRRRRR